MSLIESTAAFCQQCDEITSDGTLRTALDAQEIRSHSSIAFAMGTPQKISSMHWLNVSLEMQ